jgi:hypothetical protein
MPQARGAAAEGIPLISDTEEDFGVVKRLLSEHYAAFQGISDDDEVDDSDPTQNDFLFGALLRELGVVARHDVLFSTLRWSICVFWSGPGWVARFFRLPIALYDRLLSAPAENVADAYAALNTGLHPLVQYLSFLAGVDEKLLTARANMPRLITTSRAMLAELDREVPGQEGLAAFRMTTRDRVAWLTRIFHASLAPRRIRWVRVLGGVVLAAVAAFFVVRSVSDAVSYHPTYVERMKSQSLQSGVKATERESSR